MADIRVRHAPGFVLVVATGFFGQLGKVVIGTHLRRCGVGIRGRGGVQGDGRVVRWHASTCVRRR